MGCQKITYYNEGKPLETFRKNLKVAYTTSGVNTKKGLNSSTFGMMQPGRNFGAEDSRFGFQSQEKDDRTRRGNSSLAGGP